MDSKSRERRDSEGREERIVADKRKKNPPLLPQRGSKAKNFKGGGEGQKIT